MCANFRTLSSGRQFLVTGQFFRSTCPSGVEAQSAGRALREGERAAVERALRQNKGDRGAAAAQLGISLRALQYVGRLTV